MGKWDRDSKAALRVRPFDLLGLKPGLVRPGDRAVRFLDKELAAAPHLPRALDGLLEIEGRGGLRRLFQIEFEAEPRSDTGSRVFGHWAEAHQQLRCKVRAVVFYLKPGDEKRRPQTSYRSADGGTELRFRFETLCLWRLHAEELLARPAPGTWALVALCGDATRAQVAAACRKLEQFEDEHASGELLGVWYDLSGVRFPQEVLLAMVCRRQLLMESSTYKATFAEGERSGERKGERKGLEALKRTCLRLVESKLGVLPAEAQAIEHAGNLDRLEQLSFQLIDAADPEAVRAALRSLKK